MFQFKTFSFASFEDLGMGARATGMNNAFTAVADDAFSVYYNPAGLNSITSPELASTYGKLLMGLDDNSDLGNSFLVYAHPLKKKYMNGIEDYIGGLGIAWQELRLDNLYRENILYLSYATMFKKTAFGLNLKIFRRSFGTNEYTENAIDQIGNASGEKDPVFNSGNSKRAYGLDLGFKKQFGLHDQYMFGLSLMNINQPNIGFTDTDKVPLNIKTGFLFIHDIANISADVDFKKTSGSGMEKTINTAAEKWVKLKSYGYAGVRAGFGVGDREYRSFSCGTSYRINAIQFDYGLVLPMTGIENTLGSHRVSLSFRFGQEKAEEDFDSLFLEEEKLYQIAKEALEEAKKELEIARKEAELAEQEAELARKQFHRNQQQKALERADTAQSKASQLYQRASDIAFQFFKKHVAEKIDLQKQIIVLQNIITKYKQKGVSVLHIETELNAVKRKIKQVQNDYSAEMNYYYDMKRNNVDENERRTMLNLILEKYEKQGVDVTACKEELKKL